MKIQKELISNTTEEYKEILKKWPFELSPFQKNAITGLLNGKNILITAHTGSGKCLKKGTPVMMFNGKIKNVEDIIIGDKLMGDDSTERNVLSLARGIEPMYKIILSDGDTFGCNESHILCLKYNRKPYITNNKKTKRFEVNWFDNKNIKLKSKSFNYRKKSKEECYREALEFVEEKKISQKNDFNISIKKFLKLPKSLQRNSLSYKVGVEFPEKKLKLDPYILGLWLGDGHSNSATITNQDAVILNYLRKNISKYDCYLQYRNGYTYGLTTLKPYTQRGRENIIKTILRNYNLINNKHIPDDYKFNNRDNRMKLLAGIIDSDGYYHCKTYEISQKNEMLSKDIVYLIKSLGFSCKIKKKTKSWIYKGVKKNNEYNIITFSGDNLENIPVLCKRKKCSEKRLINKPPLEYFFKLESKGIGSYYGFELDGNHKFILGNFIVTHNTLPAEFAIDHFVSKGKRVIYTGPIKALVNQKFRDFSEQFPNISFGLMTGDNKFNPEAQCVLMTQEILRNTLFQQQLFGENGILDEDKKDILTFEMDIKNELGCLIVDETHFINDSGRGRVWEETYMMMPNKIQLLMLSATLDKVDKFCDFIEKRGGPEVWVCPTEKRVVPLTHYCYLTMPESNFKTMSSSEKIDHQDKINSLIPIKHPNKPFLEETYHKIRKTLNFLYMKRIRVNETFVINQIIKKLKEIEALPGIMFIFSRKKVNQIASKIQIPLIEKDSKIPSIIEKECESLLRRKLPNFKEYLNLPEYKFIIGLLRKGIAIHHAGILKEFREMIELVFSKGYIKILLATETFAMGINMPAKSSIFTSVQKFDGNKFRWLLPHEYIQMAGRAGRRGLDDKGIVVLLPNLYTRDEVPASVLNAMLTGAPQKLESKFAIHANLILRLISVGNFNFENFITKSMLTDGINNYKQELNDKIEQLQNSSKNHIYNTNVHTLENLHQLYCEKNLSKGKQKKRKENQIRQLLDSDKFIKNDYEKYVKNIDTKKQLNDLQKQLININNYINDEVKVQINILKDKNYLVENNETLTLTEIGKLTIAIQELPSLPFGKLMNERILDTLSVNEIISVLSCFTNLHLSDEMSVLAINSINCEDKIKEKIHKIKNTMDEFYNLLTYNKLEIAEDYYIHFNLVELSMKWCNAQNDVQCYKVINEAKQYDISLGDFVKCILKINNVALELEKVAILQENLGLLEKLKLIPTITLKSCITNQSLYL
jgi:superfamily II RNA helicase